MAKYIPGVQSTKMGLMKDVGDRVWNPTSGRSRNIVVLSHVDYRSTSDDI